MQLLSVRSLLILFSTTFCFNLLRYVTAKEAYAKFTVQESDVILQNHFLDIGKSVLYVGALNKIYKLSTDLTLLQSVNTGPVNDSVECRPPPSECRSPLTITNNHNKVILVHGDTLVTCGSIYQGTCRLRDSVNLSVTNGNSIETVVPNTPDGLAVAFIADSDGEQVLYVASSNGDWVTTDKVTISTRPIPRSTHDDNDLFRTTSRIVIPQGTFDNSPLDRQFNINYIYGFTSGQFSYFVGFQPSDHLSTSKYTSKVVRLCHGDPAFHSYIELALVCANSTLDDYNLVQSAFLTSLSLDGGEPEEVLVATFSRSETEISGRPTSMSAVCIYPIEDINQAFWNRRLACARGDTGNTEINWAGSSGCTNNVLLFNRIMDSSPDEYCHTLDVQSPLGGDDQDITITASPVYESRTYITAITAIQHFETTVIFIGDSEGSFKKLRLDGGSSAIEYGSMSLHQSPIIRNGLVISGDEGSIFVISEKEITRVPIAECQDFLTCVTCHSAQDPHCGWCSLQAKCTRREDAQCFGSLNGTSLRWLSSNDDCLAITSGSPEFIPAETETEIILQVINLPTIPSDGSLRGVLVESALELAAVPAQVSSFSTVICRIPGDIQVSDAGFRKIDLQIIYDEGVQSYIIATTTLGFYDCTKFGMCSFCTEKPYGCQWDLDSYECFDGSSVIDGIEDTEMCPLVHSLPEVVIPVGGTEILFLMFGNIPSNSRAFLCKVSFVGDTPNSVILEGVVNQFSISCSLPSFDFQDPQESVRGSLEVYWGDFLIEMDGIQIGNTFLYTVSDNRNFEQDVTIYKCDQSAMTRLGDLVQQTCGVCLSVDDRYRCGWCQSLDGCLSPITSDQCPVNDYFTKGAGCPNPTVISVIPLNGHISGGTLISIAGYNLGFGPDDLRGITVVGIECSTVEFESSQLLYCITGIVTTERRGPVVVQFNDTSAVSVQEFSYVIPRLETSYPMIGPQSGGTTLVVRGINMDAGLSRIVTITSDPCMTRSDSVQPCEIIENDSAKIVCKTSAGNITEGSIAIFFDDGCEAADGVNFGYRPDPIVEEFEKLVAIVSGGIKLEITGSSFDIIQEASMAFMIGSEMFTSACSNTSTGTVLICESPTVPSAVVPLRIPAENVSLYMDGVTNYVDLGVVFPGTNQAFFEFVIDPSYYDLPSILEIPHDQQLPDLTIEGENMTLASALQDVALTVGDLDCVIFQLTNTLLRCTLPELNPGTYDITIRHGFLIISPGQIRYAAPEFPISLLGYILLAVLVVGLLLLISYCVGRRSVRKRQPDESVVHHAYFSGDSQRVSLKTTTSGDYYSIDAPEDYMSVTDGDIGEGSHNTVGVLEDVRESEGNEGSLSQTEFTSRVPQPPPRSEPSVHTTVDSSDPSVAVCLQSEEDQPSGEIDGQQTISEHQINNDDLHREKTVHYSDHIHRGGEQKVENRAPGDPTHDEEQTSGDQKGNDEEEDTHPQNDRKGKSGRYYSDRIHRSDGQGEEEETTVQEERLGALRVDYPNNEKKLPSSEDRSDRDVTKGATHYSDRIHRTREGDTGDGDQAGIDFHSRGSEVMDEPVVAPGCEGAGDEGPSNPYSDKIYDDM